MSEKFTLKANKRSDVGKGASRRLRREQGIIPAIIYGAGKDPIMVQLFHNDILKIIQNEAFFSSLLTLDVDGKKEQVVLKDMQRHPYKRQILHMDFLRIKTGEAISMSVPLHFIGDDIAPGIKLESGMVQYFQKEIEIRCLPTNLPEFIEVDLSQLHVGDSISLSNLKLPEGVEIVALQQTMDNDRTIVSVIAKRKVVQEDSVEGETGDEAAAPSGENTEQSESAAKSEEASES